MSATIFTRWKRERERNYLRGQDALIQSLSQALDHLVYNGLYDQAQEVLVSIPPSLREDSRFTGAAKELRQYWGDHTEGL